MMAASIWLAVMPAALATDLTYEDLTDEELAATDSFVIGNSLHTLFHEAGHMLVSEFGLPVLGREEDAVDNLATLMLLEGGTDDFDQALIDTADSFWLIHEASRDVGQEDDSEDLSAYYGEHGLDLQRAYQVVCLMVGHDAEDFSEIADAYELPAERRDRCAGDYEQAAASWTSVLKPHRRKPDESSAIDWIYDRPDTPDLEYAFNLMRENRLLQQVAETMTDRFHLEPGIVFHATTCGVENAFWSPSERRMTFCYELAEFYGRQSVDWMAEARESGEDGN